MSNRLTEIGQALVTVLGENVHTEPWPSSGGSVGDIEAVDLDLLPAGFVPPGYTVIPDARCAYRTIALPGAFWPRPVLLATRKRWTATEWAK